MYSQRWLQIISTSAIFLEFWQLQLINQLSTKIAELEKRLFICVCLTLNTHSWLRESCHKRHTTHPPTHTPTNIPKNTGIDQQTHQLTTHVYTNTHTSTNTHQFHQHIAHSHTNTHPHQPNHTYTHTNTHAPTNTHAYIHITTTQQHYMLIPTHTQTHTHHTFTHTIRLVCDVSSGELHTPSL